MTKRAKSIMVQGTASNAGKSLVATGLCRIFHQDGHRVAPFKSQNMALNSFITREGLEMGRAQVVQAQAAGIEPSVMMNPILLKPTGEATSQVILNGEVACVAGAGEYTRRKQEFIPAVRSAYEKLAADSDIIVIEGAGSPAEINLMEHDFVNMGMAAMADAPVLLVGDIDRGGVFASLYGTVKLLPPEHQARIKGLLINKFRGDVELLRPGLAQIEELLDIPVLGVLPCLDVDIEDEDSLSTKLETRAGKKALDVAVIRLPRLSNFTDFDALALHPAFGVRYVESTRQLGRPDLLILPGTKNTMADLLWMRQNGLEAAVKKLAAAGTPIIGICGGYQMLGERLCDPDGVEHGGEMRGLQLLRVHTRFEQGKTRSRISGKVRALQGFYACLSGASFEGYEIHMGGSVPCGSDSSPFAELDSGHPDGAVDGRVLGSYVHGLFDSGELTARLAARLLEEKGLPPSAAQAPVTVDAWRETQYDKLAAAMREALDIKRIYQLMEVDCE